MERLKEVLAKRPWLKRQLRENMTEDSRQAENRLQMVVISTRDETGRARRARMNFRATIFDAKTPADISERMERVSRHYKFNYRNRERTVGGLRRRRWRMASFESHLAVLRMIVAKNLRHVVVCEDDVMHVRPLPNPSSLEGHITLLGGRLAGPGSWRTQREDWLDSGTALAVYRSLRRGLNEIDYDRYRWLGCIAVYYPNAAAAQRVLDAYAKSNDVTYFDIFLSSNRLVTHLWFPNCFAEWSDGKSGNMHNSNWNDLYTDYPTLRPQIAKALSIAAIPVPQAHTESNG